MLERFILTVIFTFVTLYIAAVFTRFDRDIKVFSIAALTYGALAAVGKFIPLIGNILPAVGMYVVLIGSDYNSHGAVMKLCVATFIINMLFLYATVGLYVQQQL